jgi:hypothetical protein
MAGERGRDLRVAEERLLLGADHAAGHGERRRAAGGHPVATEETIATPTPTARTAASARLRARLTGTSTRGGQW